MFLRNMKGIFFPPAGSSGIMLLFFYLAYLRFGPVPAVCLCTVCASLCVSPSVCCKFLCLLDSMKSHNILAFYTYFERNALPSCVFI